jgi:hypothetical protein
MAFRRQPRDLLAVEAFEFVVAIVQCRDEVSSGASGLAAACPSVIDDEDRAAIADCVVGGR